MNASLRPAPRRRVRVFAGWRVVAGAFLLVLAGFGTIYSYAAFAEEIADAFGASPVSLSFVYALSGGTCFLVSAVSGPLADRVGPRVPAIAGMLMVALGLMVAATARSLVEIYAGYGLLIGLGAGFAYVPAMSAVQRWFVAHRGLASGIAASGIGVGTALVPPAAEAVQSVLDWRASFVVLGAAVAVIGILGALLLEPGGRRAPRRLSGQVAPAPARGLPPVVRSRGFAAAWAGTLLVSVPATLPHAMLVSTARDLGLERTDALAMLGLIGLGTIAGRFLIAAVADVAGRRATFLACCAGMAASMLIWALGESEVALQGFALLFGALQGGFVALLPAFAADAFGARAIGGVLGLLYTSRGIALLLAPPAVAAVAVAAGHALPVLAVGALGGIGTLLLARAPRHPGQAPAPAVQHAPRAERRAWSGAALALVVTLGAILVAPPARAQDGYVDTALLWSVPAGSPGAATPCARLLVLSLPRDWQQGDAAAVVAASAGDPMARSVTAALLRSLTAVLELPEGRGGGIGPCAEVPLDRTEEVLGAVAALRREAGAGIVVAIGDGASGPAVLATAGQARGNARPAAAVALGETVRFRAGAPPAAEERWSERVPHFCAVFGPVAGARAVRDCDLALGVTPAPGGMDQAAR